MSLELKKQVIDGFIEHFEKELLALIQSAKAAHEAATHDEAKSEDKHDTRAIEASYLAQGQAKRVIELETTLKEFKLYREGTSIYSQALPGSLLTLTLNQQEIYSFFSQNSGGTQITLQGKIYSLVTEHSPLGQALKGSKVSDDIEVETKSQLKHYRLKTIS